MGLAASQCRLLMLTARLHDTEFQAQTISEKRMTLARMTEQIATEYQQKVSNRILKFNYYYDSNGRQILDEPLTYAGLTAQNVSYIGQYRVTLPDGRIAVPSINDIPNVVVNSTEDEDGNTSYSAASKENIIAALQNYVKQSGVQNADTINTLLESSSSWDESTLSQAYNLCKTNNIQVAETTFTNNSSSVTISSGDEQYVVIPALSNRDFFQNALQTGSLCVQKYAKADGSSEATWNNFDILNSDIVESTYYTDDDAEAEAVYTTKSATIQSQDKLLEMQLKQVETQHQSAQTEYDSVKKVIDKNIERSFKTFG